jgi:RimJ/RimL family protein N-acetyltransferase
VAWSGFMFLAMELLRTDRLLLRHWEESDLAAFFDLYSPLGLWAVVPYAAGAVAGQPMGTVLLLPLSDRVGPTGLVEVGWHLHPEHQGQGLATEAARALLAQAAIAGIDQVLAITDLDNAASQRVAWRLGMTDDGVTERWFGLTARQYRKAVSAKQP